MIVNQPRPIYSILKRSLLTAICLACACCNSGTPPARSPADDAEFSQASASAMLAYDHGDLDTAASLFTAALRRARMMDDARTQTDSACNLAACEIALNRLDSAENHLAEARYFSLQAPGHSDAVLLLTAKLDYLQEHDTDAESIAKPLTKSDSATTRLEAQSLLTLIACDLANRSTADARLNALRTMKSQSRNITASVSAEIEKAEGAVARLEDRPREAAIHFDTETDFLRAAGRYRDMIHSLSRSGEMHEKAGELSPAADRYYRAARAAAAIGARQRSSELAAKALAIAKASNNSAIMKLSAQLLQELAKANS
jgi:hypothetical protein